MASTCATIAPMDHRHPLFQLRAKMQRCDHKYAIPPPPPLPMMPAEAATHRELSVNANPRTPRTARDAERIVALSPPPTPGRHRRRDGRLGGSERNARTVDVSSYPEFLPASRKRRLPSSSFDQKKERRLTALKNTKAAPPAPPAFRILPLFESCWVAEANAKLSTNLDSKGTREKKGGSDDQSLSIRSANSDPSSVPPVPFAPFVFGGGAGRRGQGAPPLPFVASPEAVRRQASLSNKLDNMSLRSTGAQAATGAKGQAFRKRTGMYARGA